MTQTADPATRPKSAHRVLQVLAPRLYNDWVLRPNRSFVDGAVAQGQKIAIYLIFPRLGVSENHLHSLRYLRDMGYSPYVVANLPLTPVDHARLRPVTWRIMQRQNFGYDFGGYRDAILDLAAQLHHLHRLVLLNDSTWFPLSGRLNWLQIAQDSDCDLFGANKYGDLVKPKAEQFATAEWRVDPKSPKLHYGSFAMSFGPAILRSAGFMRFWRRLRISNGKWRSIRRGEVGLSRWAIGAGFRHGALSDHSQMNHVLTAMPLADFDRLWADFLRNKTDFFDRLSPQSLTNRHLRQKFLEMAIAHLGAEYLLPRWFIETENFPFLKKTTLAYDRNHPKMLHLLLNELGEPMADQILQECR